MYTLSSIAQRAGLVGVAAALTVAVIAPAASVFADALNPLTERSLLLSSSAPGWQNTDGSGNSNASPNFINENYAPAGSGPNGMKTGETFTFTLSSTAAVKGFSLQYCTTAAGLCQAPGNNLGDAKSGATTPRQANGGEDGGHANETSDFDVVGEFTPGTGEGQFEVTVGGVSQPGWTMTTSNLEDSTHSGKLTGKKNYITLTNPDGPELETDDEVKIIFRASESNYITNPGSKEFFVKINTYSAGTTATMIGNHNDTTPEVTTDHTVIDGGVTVANVMTDSIHITTKVLETMSFSVGTENRDTVDVGSGELHGKCDPITVANNNRLNLGNPNAEYSLETGRAWDAYSYWRLSSNSSGGASVYYSGDTLRNTVGDHIKDMKDEVASTPGTEQFGLGFVNPGFGTEEWEDTKDDGSANPDNGVGTWAEGYLSPSSYPFVTLAGQDELTEVEAGDGRNFVALTDQDAAVDYDEAEGTIFDDSGDSVAPGTAKFKFLETSLKVPELIAQQNETVISCATAKMRYVANIGADTPAGVYTTKINYLAAPQY